MDGLHDALHEVLEGQVRLQLVGDFEDALEHLGAPLETLVHGLHLPPQVAVLKGEGHVVRHDRELLERLRRHERRVVGFGDQDARDQGGSLERQEHLMGETRIEDEVAVGTACDARSGRGRKERRLEVFLGGEPVEERAAVRESRRRRTRRAPARPGPPRTTRPPARGWAAPGAGRRRAGRRSPLRPRRSTRSR